MTTISRINTLSNVTDGMRPVNLRTDLAPLADLIELVFADTMDSGGRAALREMRYLSKIGPGLGLLNRVNDIAMGANLGYVWIADGRLVGNVSVYPANWHSELGSGWIIANVGVHPDYQGRGIARRLMQSCMDMIYQRGGNTAILQVDVDNHKARHLYHSLGFVDERTWINWRRNSSSYLLTSVENPDVYIRHRRRGEWRQEILLAERIRPQKHGGLGWLRPLHHSQFYRVWWKQLGDWINLRNTERLVLCQPDYEAPLASLWVENAFANKTRLTLLVEPEYQNIHDDALLQYAVRRFGRSPLVIEHPADEVATNEVLRKYHFHPQRTVVHMRWDAR